MLVVCTLLLCSFCWADAFTQAKASIASALLDWEDIKILISYELEDLNRVNEKLEESPIPDLLKSVFGNERMNVYVEFRGEEHPIGVETRNLQITEVDLDGFENQTLNVHISWETMLEIAESDSASQAAFEALQDGKIKYEGVTYYSAVKYSIIGFVQSVIGFFAGFFG